MDKFGYNRYAKLQQQPGVKDKQEDSKKKPCKSRS